MMAMATSNSISVKPRREFVPPQTVVELLHVLTGPLSSPGFYCASKSIMRILRVTRGVNDCACVVIFNVLV